MLDKYIKGPRAEKRKSDGTCHYCSNPNERGVRCDTCKEKQKARYLARKATGICLTKGCKELAAKPSLRCQAHIIAWRDQMNKVSKKRRDDTFAAYGGYRCRCLGCKCTTPEFIQLDHIDNDGKQHRKVCRSSGSLYSWLKKNNYPPIVQPMCANCNFAKGHYGACPLVGQPH